MAGNDRRQKRAASSRNNGESAPNLDDDEHTEQSGAGHTETDVIGEVRFCKRREGGQSSGGGREGRHDWFEVRRRFGSCCTPSVSCSSRLSRDCIGFGR